MKTNIGKLALIAVALHCAITALGQGTVNFANQTSILSSPPDRLVRFVDGKYLGIPIPDGTPFSTNASDLNFSGYHAQLFYGAIANEVSLVAVTTAPAGFRNSTSASVGTWFGGTRTLTGFNPGDVVQLQVRVWDLNLAPDWATASQPSYSGYIGKSSIFTYTIPTSATPAPAEFIMANFQGFSVPLFIPEPAAPALLGLAALCFTVFRRACR